MIGKILIGGFIFSFLPIWRGAGLYSRKDGANLWQLMEAASRTEYSPFGCPHILYSEAVERARNAYLATRGQ